MGGVGGAEGLFGGSGDDGSVDSGGVVSCGGMGFSCDSEGISWECEVVMMCVWCCGCTSLFRSSVMVW